jgi:hypothetical protein
VCPAQTLKSAHPRAPPLHTHSELYDDEDAGGDGDEPELRRQLRAARLAEKHAKMKAALAEKQVHGRERRGWVWARSVRTCFWAP